MESIKTEETIASSAKCAVTEQNKSKNEALATELNFELLKQYAWLSSAVCGGLILLIQMEVIESGKDVYISLMFFGLSILCAIFGQDYIVDSLLKDKRIYDISTILSRIRFVAMMSIGIGAGYLNASLFLFN
ncbi:hypothetical protein [Arsukibacterium sp.]|uniref:hypothetical protein n=1 Tax=Arsukibacterium sp. TaxID=1977258 RepID=UPI003568115C